PAQLDSHETTRTVCALDKWPGAQLRLRWKTFRAGASEHVASVAVDVSQPAAALSLRVTKVELHSSNLTPGGPYQGMALIWIACPRETLRLMQTGGDFIQLAADGTAPLPTSLKVM